MRSGPATSGQATAVQTVVALTVVEEMAPVGEAWVVVVAAAQATAVADWVATVVEV